MKDEDRSGHYRLDDQVGYILRRVTQRHVQIFQDLAPDELTPTQFATLARLAEVGPTSQNHLGRLTSMDVATIKGVVARLFAKGLVTMTADPDDRRRTLIALSDTAEEMIDDLQEAGHRISAATLEPLAPEERDTLVTLLRRLT